MKLSRTQIEKADDVLKDALERARPDETLTTVLVLEAADAGESSASLDPASFVSMADYRRALIAQHDGPKANRHAATFDALCDLSLDVRGDRDGPVVVVSGPARQISKALELPDVQSAQLNRTLKLLR